MTIRIGLDAGHGGDSTGTYTINTDKDKLYEKDYCLELCRLVRDRLLANGFEVFMTRNADILPGDVSERAKMCLNAKCNYAVSIHFNGVSGTAANGTEVFVPYAETGAGIECGYKKYLGEFFTIRNPFARSNNYYDRNETFDKKLNLSTRKFDAVDKTKKDYFGFIRTAWANGLSADLLEVCFLTNRKDFDTYAANKGKIADAIAKAIVEGYKGTYKKVNTVVEETKTIKNTTLYLVQVGAFGKKENADALADELKKLGYSPIVKIETK